jgi:hypothetical protein
VEGVKHGGGKMGIAQFKLGLKHAKLGLRYILHRKQKKYDSDRAQEAYNNGYSTGEKERRNPK